jgi:esterase/lipase
LKFRFLLSVAAWSLGVAVIALPLAAQGDSASYSRSVAAIARRQAVDDRVAAPGARSILLTTGAPTPRAILLLHGLTDSPRQFEAFAYLLHADGNNVYVPRLPQHGLRGMDAGALGQLTAEQLREAADSVVGEIRGLGQSVVVVGLSMGGTVAAWIAQERAVGRAVLIAPAIEPGRIPFLLDRPLIGLADRLPSMTRRSAPDSARPDREVGFNSRAVAEVLELGRSVLAEAARVPPQVREIVVLVNANDRTINASAAEQLAREWLRHGAGVSVLELPDSLRLPHNIIDPIRGRVGGDTVLAMLRSLTYGDKPSALVKPVPLR